jgi:hypothetical protein
VDYADNRGDRQRKHFHNKKAADAFRISVEGQMQAGTYRPDADKVTLREVCASFLEHCEARNERDERVTRKMLAVYLDKLLDTFGRSLVLSIAAYNAGPVRVQ